MFKDIVAHEGPLKPGDPSYKGSSYNVLVEWEDGSKTFEPLTTMGADSPVVCAMYGKRMGLLDQPGWKRFKNIAKREKKMLRMINQAKLQSFRRAPVYQFGYRVPRSAQEAINFDKENGNKSWQDAMQLEMEQLKEYDTFKDLGKESPPPAGYRKIRVHFVFAVKHDGRHKARLVADRHLTETPLESVTVQTGLTSTVSVTPRSNWSRVYESQTFAVSHWLIGLSSLALPLCMDWRHNMWYSELKKELLFCLLVWKCLDLLNPEIHQ
jgi:hypothetical protein